MYILRISFIAFVAILMLPSFYSRAVEPEDILGEYWKDPLFGVASANSTFQVEVLYKLLFPEQMEVFNHNKTRFVFHNKSDQVHVFLFSKEPSTAIADEDFKSFVEDEVRHATMEVSSNDGHVHSQNSSDEARSIVGNLDDRPTMTLQPWDQREILLQFHETGTVYLRCILEGHEDQGHQSVIRVVEADFLKETENQ